MKYGSCLCGKIAYRFEGPIRFFNHCHCSQCRKAHGAAFGSFIHVFAKHFAWLRGIEHLGCYHSEGQDDRIFCTHCGSNMPLIEEQDDNVIIPAGTLDSKLNVQPTVHIFVANKASWYEIHDPLPQFPQCAPNEWVESNQIQS